MLMVKEFNHSTRSVVGGASPRPIETQGSVSSGSPEEVWEFPIPTADSGWICNLLFSSLD